MPPLLFLMQSVEPVVNLKVHFCRLDGRVVPALITDLHIQSDSV